MILLLVLFFSPTANAVSWFGGADFRYLHQHRPDPTPETNLHHEFYFEEIYAGLSSSLPGLGSSPLNFNLIGAYHPHSPSDKTLEIHEATITQKTHYLGTFYGGLFPLPLGPSHHQHPLEQRKLKPSLSYRRHLDEDGVFGTGVGNYANLTKKLTLNTALTNGRSFRHTHTATNPAPTRRGKRPTITLRAQYALNPETSMGTTYFDSIDGINRQTRMHQLDLSYQSKWSIITEMGYFKENYQNQFYEKVTFFHLQSLDYAFYHQTFAALDFSKDLSLRTTSGKLNHVEYEGSLGHFYAPNAFMRLGAEISHRFTRLEGTTTEQETLLTLALQLQFGDEGDHTHHGHTH